MIARASALAAFVLAAGLRSGVESSPAALREVEIVGRDYAFAAPSEIAAGTMAFRFTNKGTVVHEMSVALLTKDTRAQQVVAALNAKQPLKPLIDSPVGILFARPGQRSSVGLSTQLLAGRDYLVICSFQDSASTPMHARMGMVSVIHVSSAPATMPAAKHVDTIVGTDYAFRAAPTLAPGRHTIAFMNAGSVKHEVNIALLRPGVTLQQVFDIAKVDGDLNRQVEEWVGVLSSPAGRSPLGQLRVALLAGREYVLMCQFTNDDKSPSHLTLGMFGSIRAAETMRTTAVDGRPPSR